MNILELLKALLSKTGVITMSLEQKKKILSWNIYGMLFCLDLWTRAIDRAAFVSLKCCHCNIQCLSRVVPCHHAVFLLLVCNFAEPLSYSHNHHHQPQLHKMRKSGERNWLVWIQFGAHNIPLNLIVHFVVTYRITVCCLILIGLWIADSVIIIIM